MRYIGNLIAAYGDVFSFRLATTRIVAINHPRDIKHVLQQKSGNYVRDTAAHKMARTLFGDGLATVAGGLAWRRQRRLMQPAFHRQRIATMSARMVDTIGATLDRWRHAAAANEAVDTHHEMRELTLRIVARTLFALDDEPVMRRFADAVDAVGEELTAYMRFPLLPLSVPTPGHRRFWSAIRVIEQTVKHVMQMHHDDDADCGDLLTMLMRAEDEETGERMTDKQLRDEVFTLLFAGHETSANVLTWTWYRLGRHIDVQDRIRAEIDRELGDRVPTLADCDKLTYTRCVIEEVMRLYPQQWQGWRRAVDEDELGGYRIPAGTDIFFSVFHTHRHPEFWDDAERFQPERFMPERSAGRDRAAYIPFGYGPHLCIGNQFAMTEMLLIVASTMQRYRFELVDAVPVAPRPLLTLGPDRPVPIRLTPRS